MSELDALLLTRVELDGRPGIDVLLSEGRVAAIGPTGTLREPRANMLDGGGGALIRGLTDHHLHLFATAAADGSVACGPPDALDRDGLGSALRTAATTNRPGEWIRGTGWDDEGTGPLTTRDLDDLMGPFADRPVRLAHRSGHAWLLNSEARRRLGLPAGDELLLDADDVVRQRLGGSFPALGPLSRRLARAGVTGVTDAGVHNGPAELAALQAASTTGELVQRCLVLGAEDLPGVSDGLVTTGALKIVLAEHDLPGLDDLAERVRRAGPRLVAVHAVSLEALLLAVAALAAPGAGGRTGHRIEHASVAPPEIVAQVRRVGARIVTQPAFVFRHGDRYRRTVVAEDQPWLYRLRAWLDAGVPLAAGSDSPYGPEDPWAAMRSATTRRTAGGAPLGPAESLSPEQALALFTSPAESPGLTTALRVGDRADLCLLAFPWRQAREELDASLVRATIVEGRLVEVSEQF